MSEQHRAAGLLHAFAHTLSKVDVVETAIYVVLSLAVALAGSLVAILLVPLVQPGHAVAFVGGMLDAHGDVDKQALFFAAATLSFALLRWLTSRLGARLVARYGMGLRRAAHARLIDASLVSFADLTSAEIANVLTHNIELVIQGFGALQQLLVACVTSAVSVAFALWLSPQLVLAAPVLAVLGLIVSRISTREQVQVSRQYVVDMTRLFWHSEDFHRRLRHVRSFEREEAEKASYGDISARLGHGYRRQLELIASGRLVLELMMAVGIAAIFMLAHRWQGFDRASFIAVGLLLGRLLPYLVSTRQNFQQLRLAAPAFELWERYTRLESAHPSTAPARAPHAGTTLHIERMRVNPPSNGLDIVDLRLNPGELTAIAGDSGIGKSSLVDVLAGMMTPEMFVARADNRSIEFGEYRELVSHGAYVSQSVRPWQHSVRECLLWAAPDATEAMLLRALVDVGLDKRLLESDRGLDTSLQGSSSRLSGGELQRLLLAQVILRQPSLALLDEATSALDAASEIAVLSALKRCLPQTILIVVSHRSGVATLADQCVTIGNDLVATVVGNTDLRRTTSLAG
jgi:ATP-binding cassette subfamily C protein